MKFTLFPKGQKSNEQVQEYLHAVKRGENSTFVVETEFGWRVQSVKSKTPIKILPTQQEAVACAKQLHDNREGEVFVYSKNGTLLERMTPSH